MSNTDYVTKEYLDKKFEEFAIMIANGFSDVDRRFVEQEKNLKEYMNDTFATKVDLYGTETRMNTRFDGLDSKISKIEGYIGRKTLNSVISMK